MKISACVIVKNEERNIGKWLSSMESLADEMIVVDTGSTDETKKLASQAGAMVFDYPWQNDFAAAKNYAIDKAKGDWIVFLDADEYFAPKTAAQLRDFLGRLDVHQDVVAVLCRLVNIDEDNNNRFMTSFMQLRIFRNLKKLRYTGAIHETLTIPKRKKVELAQELTVYHTGYSTSIVKKKLQRNLEMLQAKFAQNEGRKTAQEERYLMDIWYGLGEHDKAVEAAKGLLARGDLDEDLRGRAYETWASVCIEDNYAEEDTRKCLDEAIVACPQRADFRLMKGLYLFDLQDFLEAEQELQQGMQLRQKRPQDKDLVGMADTAERLIPTVEWRLAELCQLKFQVEAACEHYLAGLSLFPYNEGVCRSFFSFLRNNQVADTDIIEQLNILYDKKKDASFIVKTLLREKKAGRVVIYYANQGGLELTKKLKYQLNGNWGAAAEVDAIALDRDAGILMMAAAHGVEHAQLVLQQLYASHYPKWKSWAFQKRLQRMCEELSVEVDNDIS